MNRGTTWKKLVRKDLTTFDDNATRVVLAAMGQNAVGRITGRGHAFIKAPNGGGTMSVSRDTSAPNCLKNVEADFRRLFGAQQESTTKDESKATMHTDSRYMPFTDVPYPSANGKKDGEATVAPSNDLMILCPAKGCEAEFVTEGAKYTHIKKEHFECTHRELPGVSEDKWPASCTFGVDGTAHVAPSAQSLAGHVNVHHLGNKPWEHRDPAKRSEAARKGAATRARNAGRPVVAEVKRVAVPVVSVEKRPDGVLVADSTPEHRGLPTGDVTHKPATDAAKLREIRKLLGDDPAKDAEVVKLKARIAELEAQLELVAEVLHLANPAKKK